MPSKLDHALALAGRGFRAFPLEANGKKPAIKNWDKLATTDEATIRRWWNEDETLNIGLATGQGIVVLDYDMKEGQQGEAALRTHDMLGLPLDGFQVTTPSGGLHVYFKTDKTIRNSASKVAKNVDVRGDGGYVVAPGSTIENRLYESVHKTDSLPELPDWMAQLAMAPKTKSTVDPREALGDLDRLSQIEAAQDWLEQEAPEAIEGAGGDETTYKVACRVRDFGISPQQCIELMAHWNELKASPPWPLDDLEQKVRNAYEYATLPIGIADPKGELGDVTSELYSLETHKAKPQNKLYYLTFTEAADTALESVAEPLIDDLLDCGTLSTLYGRPKSGKTFNALDLEFCVAAGIDWNGHPVKQGLVVHIAAEGGLNIKKRIAALKKHHGIRSDVPLAVVPCPINLLDASRDGDTRKLIELIRKAEQDYNQKCVMVVIDTLSRALAGGDENSSTDMGTFIRHVDRLREQAKAHVMIVHHSGKDQAKGMRGWSGMLAALDTEIEVHEGKFTVTNQRDMECLEPVHFRLKTIELGTNSRGKIITSCVVEIRPTPDMELPLTPEQHAMYRVVLKLRDQKRRQNPTEDDIKVTFAEAFEAYNNNRRSLESEPVKMPQVSKLLKAIKETGRKHNVDFDQWFD